LLFGYIHSFITRMERPLTRELVQFHRREQLDRLKTFLLNGRRAS